MLGLVLLALFFGLSLLLQQRCAALLQLAKAQERVDTYIYLLDYIKTQCVPQRAEETDQKEEWLILRGVNSYRILWEEDSYAAYHGMRCLLRAYASDEGIEEVRFGTFAQ